MHFDLPFLAVTIFILDWILRIVCLIYIPRGRRPSSATAWLLTIFIFPTVGLILFFLIGSPKLSRRRRAIQRRIDGIIARTIPHDDPSLEMLPEQQRTRIQPITELAHNLTNLPVVGGNDLKLHTNYELTIQEIVQQVTQAKHTVYLEFYIIALDDSTQSLFDALAAAVQRGVSVYVMFDAIGSRKYKQFKRMKQLLDEIGVHWRAMLPVRLRPAQYNRPDLRNHRKIAVFDFKVAYIGSLNLIDKCYERKDNIAYEELTAELRGPIVYQCAAIFAGDWYGETGEILPNLPPTPPSPAHTSVRALTQLIPSGPSYPHENNLNVFISLLYAARKRIVITNPYFVPDEALLMAVIAAAKRGVEVTIINSEAKDQWMVAHAQRSYYEELLRAGVKIYLHKAPILLHAKHITIDDDIAVIGSSNMDIRSFQLIMECVVVAYDKQTVTQLKKVQRHNLAHSRKISLGTWQKRGITKQFLDAVARLTAALQ